MLESDGELACGVSGGVDSCCVGGGVAGTVEADTISDIGCDMMDDFGDD